MSNGETFYHFKSGGQQTVLNEKKLPHIGVYAATFDPVHAGHITFALKAQKIAGLEQIYFVPERKPHGAEPEHYVHRSIMLQRALQPYQQFEIFDIPDARLTSSSINRVVRSLPEANFSLLTTASDLLWHEGELPALYRKCHLVVAVISHSQMAEVLARLTRGDNMFGNITFIDIGTDHVSSTAVRQGIRTGRQVHGILPSVWRYARQQWLYVPPIRRG